MATKQQIPLCDNFADMRVGFQRWLDYWFGRPLCFFLTLCLWIRRKFPSRNTASEFPPKKIIFFGLSEMGSIILSLPALKMAKELFPHAELYFLTFLRNRECLLALDIIPRERVISINDKNIFVFAADTLKAARSMRAMRINAVVDFELFARYSTVLSFLSGAFYRLGFGRFSLEGLYRGRILTHDIFYNPYLHIAENFLSLIYSLHSLTKGLPMFKRPEPERYRFLPKISSTTQEKEEIFSKLQENSARRLDGRESIVILSPGASSLLTLRQWPLDSYIALSRLLLEDERTRLVIIGGNDDRPAGKKIMDGLKSSRCINMVGKTSIKELIALFNISKAFISHDSGPAQLSALTNISSVVIFGPETNRLYAPLGDNLRIVNADFACSPCVSAYNHRRSLCRDNRCLKAVSPQEIYQFVKERL